MKLGQGQSDLSLIKFKKTKRIKNKIKSSLISNRNQKKKQQVFKKVIYDNKCAENITFYFTETHFETPKKMFAPKFKATAPFKGN